VKLGRRRIRMRVFQSRLIESSQFFGNQQFLQTSFWSLPTTYTHYSHGHIVIIIIIYIIILSWSIVKKQRFNNVNWHWSLQYLNNWSLIILICWSVIGKRLGHKTLYNIICTTVHFYILLNMSLSGGGGCIVRNVLIPVYNIIKVCVIMVGPKYHACVSRTRFWVINY